MKKEGRMYEVGRKEGRKKGRKERWKSGGRKKIRKEERKEGMWMFFARQIADRRLK